MPVDDSKLAFYSGYPIDKIFAYTIIADSFPSGTLTKNLSATIPAGLSLPDETTFVATLPNPYGKRGLVTLSWSFDGINYVPQNTQIQYFNNTFASFLTQMTCAGGCDDNLITILATTAYTAPQTIYFQFAVDTPT